MRFSILRSRPTIWKIYNITPTVVLLHEVFKKVHQMLGAFMLMTHGFYSPFQKLCLSGCGQVVALSIKVETSVAFLVWTHGSDSLLKNIVFDREFYGLSVNTLLKHWVHSPKKYLFALYALPFKLFLKNLFWQFC